jgi:predicted deacylase
VSTVPSNLRIHQYAGLQPGPRLVILGAVHGNEVCGTRAIERLIVELDKGTLRIERGTLTLVPVTNPLAYQQKQRQGDRNLNRNLRPNAVPGDFEDRIANVLCPLLEAHDVLLDLHSFHTGGQPFAMLGPRDNADALEPFAHATEEARLAAHLGVARVVEGWLDTYALGVERRRARHPEANPLTLDTAYGVGTTEYMRSCGGYGVTLECGQHDDPDAPEVAWRAIRQTLALLKLIDAPLQAPPESFEVLRLQDVVDREHPGDAFVRDWASFDPVKADRRLRRIPEPGRAARQRMVLFRAAQCSHTHLTPARLSENAYKNVCGPAPRISGSLSVVKGTMMKAYARPVIGALLMAATAAWAQMPQWQTSGAAQYMCGGVSDESMDAVKGQRSAAASELLFTSGPEGAYLADVAVTVRGGGLKEPMSFTSVGPLCLLKLPKGSYTVDADFKGKSLKQTIKVDGAPKQTKFNWPAS